MSKNYEADSSNAPIKYFLLKVASLKYLYVVCLAVALITAVLYNIYSKRVYEASASISPIENKTSALLSSDQRFGNEYMQSFVNIENEINNLRSFPLVLKTITDMNLEVSYSRESKGIFKQRYDLYNETPVFVTIDKSHIQPVNARFSITILNETSFRLVLSDDDVTFYNYLDNQVKSENNTLTVDTICKFNETISNRYFRFSVALNKDRIVSKNDSDYKYFFWFNHLDFLTKSYLDRLKVERVSQLASIILIRFRGENNDKTITFLNRFINTFLEENLSKKNKMALSTVNFIDNQISGISDSLSRSESALKNYRSANQVMDLSFQGQRIYEQRNQIDAERANLQVQERYYNYVINYLKVNTDVSGVVPPSAMNVNDPITNQLISELLNLNNQRSSVTSGSNAEKNIFVGQIDNKIRLQKQAIIENFTNNLNTLVLSLNELDYREEKLSREISRLPRTEMNMVSMQRKFNLNDAIYTFLLQKRSEAAISLASNYPDFEIVEQARAITAAVISPKQVINLILALIIGILLPTLFIVVRDTFDTKIRSINDAEYLLKRSQLSVIYRNENKSETVVDDFPKSAIAESFRNLRSSLFMRCAHVKSKVILVTSSQPQDGKSFISLNLASSIASVGYKTLLIDSDLRRPVLHRKLNMDNSTGLSNYMAKNATADDILFKTPVKNLHFIPAGPGIPNPTELMEAGVLDNLINSLKDQFEYIIIDTTPIGIVADAMLMMKYASNSLLVIRNNYTRKDILQGVVASLKVNKLSNYDIVFNDLDLQKSSYKYYSKYYIKK